MLLPIFTLNLGQKVLQARRKTVKKMMEQWEKRKVKKRRRWSKKLWLGTAWPGDYRGVRWSAPMYSGGNYSREGKVDTGLYSLILHKLTS